MNTKNAGLVAKYLELLNANADAFWNDRIGYAAFDRRAKQLWFCIEGSDAEVVAAVRKALLQKAVA